MCLVFFFERKLYLKVFFFIYVCTNYNSWESTWFRAWTQVTDCVESHVESSFRWIRVEEEVRVYKWTRVQKWVQVQKRTSFGLELNFGIKSTFILEAIFESTFVLDPTFGLLKYVNTTVYDCRGVRKYFPFVFRRNIQFCINIVNICEKKTGQLPFPN